MGKPDKGQILRGFPTHYSEGLRVLSFQLLGFYYISLKVPDGFYKGSKQVLLHRMVVFDRVVVGSF